MPARLHHERVDDIHVWTDPALRSRSGILVAFTERGGGSSPPPFSSLNLAHHVGDDPATVDGNRDALLAGLGLGGMRERLVTAEQVHGAAVAAVDDDAAGAGAFASGVGNPPLPRTDGLVTTASDLPLMLLFADCVPVILVAETPQKGIAVAHAGWRGAAAKVHVAAVERLVEETGAAPRDLLAYVGPHICPCHYQVGQDVLARFDRDSATLASARGNLDLGAVVEADLERNGVPIDRIVALARCTAEHTEDFYSFRAERTTGRHGALAVILGGRR